MGFKLIDAHGAKPGANILIEGAPCTVRSQDISKTGKHGHSKARIEAIGIFDGKKRVLVVPGDDRFEVPLIEKRKCQILSVSERPSVMDLESFETIEVEVDPDIKDKLEEGKQFEYWNIENRKMIKREI